MRNIEKLAEAEKGMNESQKKDFVNYFLGAIAHLSKPEDWEEALKTARRCVTPSSPLRGEPVTRG